MVGSCAGDGEKCWLYRNARGKHASLQRHTPKQQHPGLAGKCKQFYVVTDSALSLQWLQLPRDGDATATRPATRLPCVEWSHTKVATVARSSTTVDSPSRRSCNHNILCFVTELEHLEVVTTAPHVSWNVRDFHRRVQKLYWLFIARQHTERDIVRANPSACPSVGLSVRHTLVCIETNAHIVKLFPTSGRGMTLIFLWRYRRYKIPRGTPSAGALNTRDGKKLWFSTYIDGYLWNGTS